MPCQVVGPRALAVLWMDIRHSDHKQERELHSHLPTDHQEPITLCEC